MVCNFLIPLHWSSCDYNHESTWKVWRFFCLTKWYTHESFQLSSWNNKYISRLMSDFYWKFKIGRIFDVHNVLIKAVVAIFCKIKVTLLIQCQTINERKTNVIYIFGNALCTIIEKNLSVDHISAIRKSRTTNAHDLKSKPFDDCKYNICMLVYFTCFYFER